MTTATSLHLTTPSRALGSAGAAQARVAPRPGRRPGHRFYQGERGQSGCRVWVTESSGSRFLAGRTREPLSSYSWGRLGVTAQELAWAVLFDCSDDPQLADDWFVEFSSEVISRLPHHEFCLAAQDVFAWLDVSRGTEPLL